jgi:uncharacterized protein (DUF302 family)
MDVMNSRQIAVERLDIVTNKSFEQVLRELEKGIGRPDMKAYFEQKAAAQSFEEYERLVKSAVGPADLMEFMRLDPGAVLRKDPVAKAFNAVRIIAGNPLIMKKMTEHVPDAGSYAPITILVTEREDGVHLSYDSMSSYLAPYQNPQALKIARELDEKVIGLLQQAAN